MNDICKYPWTHNHTNHNPMNIYFVSRYQGTSYYCVDGEEVALRDSANGERVITRGNLEQFEKLRLFLIEEYAEFIRWNVTQRAKHTDFPHWTTEPFQPIYY